MPQNADRKCHARPLYHAAKISDYRFRRVLACFVCDHTATETAQRTGLSVNSVDATFRKLRVFFFEARLFTDIYDGADPTAHWGNDPAFEKALLEFHFARIRAHRGLKSPAHEPDYHFAESHWRYHFHVLARERTDAPVETMMFSHLLEIIRLCGPAGAKPRNHRAGIEAVLRQMDQRIAWLERNAPGFGTDARRRELRGIRGL